MSNRTELSRRTLLKVMGGVGASFALGVYPAVACNSGKADDRKGAAFIPNVWVKVDPDGAITVTVCKSDMGQGVRTSFAMLVAEEMDADWTKVKVVQAGSGGGQSLAQGTGGSGSIIGMHGPLRQAGAAARAMLIAAAAKTWNVDPSACKTENGKVLGPGGKSVAYGDLTTVAQGIAVPADVKLKDKSEFKLIGKGATRIDNPAVVAGTAMYGIDAKVDGMVYAVIARKPAFGATLDSVDDSAARKVPGVIDVVKVASGVAVVADNTWNAIKGREALKLNWNLGPNADLNSEKISAALKAAVGPHMDLPAGAKTIEATYELPFLAHATMEPMNALADVRDGACTIWTGTQSPEGAQGQVAQRLGIPRQNVTVNVMLLGGGFGRRLANEYAVEAAEISQAVKKPVKLLWTRDDDMKHDNYRPAGYHAMKGVLDEGGNVIGWSHQAIGSAGRAAASEFRNARIPYYNIEKSGMRGGGAGVPVPTGAWRSVENTLNNVANECFIDELAHAAGQDPFEFRKKHLKDDRLRKVLETAAEKANWGKPLPAGHGHGIACFAGYGSCAAHVMEVSVEGKKVKVHRAVCVIDCGMAINPKGVEAQVQGACTDGLSTALRAAITIEKGGVKESSWYDYQWMTIDAMPKVEVYIVESGGEPGGMGEPPYPSVAPAVANAVFAATGKRVRKFPIKVDELV